MIEGIDAANIRQAKATKRDYKSLFEGRWTLKNPLNAPAEGIKTISRERMRWSSWANAMSGEQLVTFVRDEVFPFFAKVGEDYGMSFMTQARLAIDEPTVLTQVVTLVNELRLEQADPDTKGDMFEHVLRQIRQAGELGHSLDQDALNQSHQIVIVAAELDAASERIVNYLNSRDIPINVLCFQVFETGAGQLLSRAWLLDPVETQTAAAIGGPASIKEPWNGEYYATFGHSESRDWDEARRYGFISAGGGSWYSGTLSLLKADDLIWVKAPGYGFVGVGRVRSGSVPITDFKLRDESGIERPALELLTQGSYHKEFLGDTEREEYFVPVDWIETRPLEAAVNETGMFGNQNIVCAPKTPKWRHTVERLKEHFPKWKLARMTA